jgi:hypothetical protein
LEIKIKETVALNDVHTGVNGTRGHFVILTVEVENRPDNEHVSVSLANQHQVVKEILWKRLTVMPINAKILNAVSI